MNCCGIDIRLVVLVFSLWALSSVGIFAQTKPFHPTKNQICSKGQNLSLGCDAIRARDIVEAKQFPFSAIGRVNYAGFKSKKHCTGTLIAPQTVLTAAHCLHLEDLGRWLLPEEIVFVAGYERSEYLGFSKVKRYKIDASVKSQNNGNISPLYKDWAILELRDPIGDDTGHLETSETIPSEFAVAGYPGLRLHVLSMATECTESLSQLRQSKGLLLHDCAIMAGDSGGPVLATDGEEMSLIAINIAVFVENDHITAVSIPVSEIPIVETLEDWGHGQ